MTRENPSYPLLDWQNEVANLTTTLGYDEWLTQRIARETGVDLNTEQGYTLTRMQGQAIAEILRRYIGEELRPRIEDEDSMIALNEPDQFDEITKDIEYIEGLEQLFADDNTMPLWESNDVQFPRLLSEIFAEGCLDGHNWDTLLRAMDLESDELAELFDRAQRAFELVKAAHFNERQTCGKN